MRIIPRTTSTLPDDLHHLIEGSVDAGIFENKSDAIRHALRDFFDEHEDARMAAAIHRYEHDEISLGKAARLAGVSRFDMPDLLREHGVRVNLGPDDMEAGHREIDPAHDLESVRCRRNRPFAPQLATDEDEPDGQFLEVFQHLDERLASFFLTHPQAGSIR